MARQELMLFQGFAFLVTLPITKSPRGYLLNNQDGVGGCGERWSQRSR